jgi:CHASE3 domain sensor protein
MVRPITEFESRLRRMFGIYFGVLFATVAMSIYTINNEITHLKWVAHTYEVISGIAAVNNDMMHAHANARGYALTAQAGFLGDYRNACDKIVKDVAHLKFLTIDNETQQANIPRLQAANKQKLDFTDSVIETRDRQGLEASANLYAQHNPNALLHAFDECIADMSEEEQRLLAVRQDKATAATMQVQVLLPCMILLNVGIVVYIYYLITSRVEEHA